MLWLFEFFTLKAATALSAF